MADADVDRFVAALQARHAAPLRRPEFLKAIRALSARYVERRAELSDRSPLDSAGKRAAFAAYYAPLHFVTTTEILRALGAGHHPLEHIVDLGCGTGVAGAAWARERANRPRMQGVDKSGWAVDEATWTYRTLGLGGRATRGDLIGAASDLAVRAKREPLNQTGVILGWSVNELAAPGRASLLASVLELARLGAAVLVIEPIARRAAPWFDDWADAVTRAGGRQDLWKFDAPRPEALADLAEAAGFSGDALTARSLWLASANGNR